MLKQFTCCALAASLLVGCSSGPNNPPTQTVTGTVTLGGKAIEGAIVTFVPEQGGTGQPAAGKSDASGKYSLTTFVADDGAVVGAYKVKVSKYELGDGGMSPYGDSAPAAPAAPAKKMTEEEEMALMEGGYTAADAQPDKNSNTKRKNELPEKYSNTASSGLSYTVVEGDNNYDLELKK